MMTKLGHEQCVAFRGYIRHPNEAHFNDICSGVACFHLHVMAELRPGGEDLFLGRLPPDIKHTVRDAPVREGHAHGEAVELPLQLGKHFCNGGGGSS